MSIIYIRKHIFEGDFRTFNRLVFVDKGETTITYSYPYLIQGILVTLAGVAVAAVMVIYLRKKNPVT